MYIKVGQIVKVLHTGDNGKKKLHPFLIINISNKYIYALQCSSVKVVDDESYFSKNGIEYYELQYFDTPYITHVKLELERIDSKNLQSILCNPNWKDYNRIAQELLLVDWENNDEWNDNQIKQQIWTGIDSFGKEWEI